MTKPRMGRPVTTGRGRATRIQVVVSLSPEEAARLDAVRGALTRAEYMRRKAVPKG